LGPAGQGVESILTEDWKTSRKLFELINPSYREMFQHELEIDETSEGVSVVMVPAAGVPSRSVLADVGEGAAQALPVFVLGAQARADMLGSAPVIVLEQPEMHLHPAAELELARFLIEVAKVPGARLIVETHSENLLLFMQLALARKQLLSKNINVYFVRAQESGEGSAVERVELDEQGRLENWPPGVFSEDVELARQLFLAQRAR
jgi:predicted ATPase